jgi:hypothetical protein
MIARHGGKGKEEANNGEQKVEARYLIGKVKHSAAGCGGSELADDGEPRESWSTRSNKERWMGR